MYTKFQKQISIPACPSVAMSFVSNGIKWPFIEKIYNYSEFL